MLTILELKNDGKTLGEMALRFRCSRSRISGAIFRIQQACEIAGPWDEHDGTMPYQWWRDGLDTRTKQGELDV